ncbi:hypothetical protein [Paracoccus shandongensis]|uniref:hypothetical protein n=1 Tax=Paracoccus shandongensis TaxID=2816048 RepID=UPI001A8ED0D3|nr:hypothetical protein [Paracoccus shandongensis]
MKTAVIGEDAAGVVTYNASLVALLAYYRSAPRACQPYRPRRKARSSGRSPTSGRTSFSGAASTIWTI